MKPSFFTVLSVGVLTYATTLLTAATASAFVPAPSRVDVAIDGAHIVYTTSGSSLLRYNSNTGTVLTPWNLGGSLRGMDISPDGQYLAVGDGTTQGTQNRIFVVTLATGAVRTISFPLAFNESGTFTTAWAGDGSLLVSSSFAGSGWVPLRKVNVATGTSTVLATIRQDSMLTPSHDRMTVAIAESNISSGPVSYYNSLTGTVVSGANTNWFDFEVGVSKDGNEFAVPTYGGTFIYNRAFQQIGTLGVYASQGPISVVFSPTDNLLYAAWYSWDFVSSAVRVFDATTLAQVGTYPVQGQFNWVGNGAFQEGRIKISDDGLLLAVTVDGGVSVVPLPAHAPEPTALGLSAIGALALSARRRRA